MAFRWFNVNCTAFVKDFGLAQGRIEEMGLREEAEELFLQKLSIIYQTVMRMQMKKSEEKSKEK